MHILHTVLYTFPNMLIRRICLTIKSLSLKLVIISSLLMTLMGLRGTTVVMSNCCCRYKLLEISRLLSQADMHTTELSGTFCQVTQLLHNTTKTVLL